MISVYCVIARLLEMRDSILLLREKSCLDGCDPQKEYYMSVIVRSDVHTKSYCAEMVASFSSGGSEESAYWMEKRAAIRLKADQGISIRCSYELESIEACYSLDECDVERCLEQLRSFFS